MKTGNRRSERNKRERLSGNAQALLDSFHWEWDQRILLELAATGEIPVDQVRELRWNQLRMGFQCLIILDKEIHITLDAFNLMEKCLNEKLHITGEPWDAPEDKLFSHNTSKDTYKELISYKG